MAVHALALLEGERPADLVGHLDELVPDTGVGHGSSLVYLTVEPGAATVRMANAGHCPPIVLGPAGTASFLEAGDSPALGAAAPVAGAGDGGGVEKVVRVEPGSTVLVFTEALVRAPGQSLAEGLRRLRLAAEGAPRSLESLCDHVLASCRATDGAPTGGYVSLLAVRLLA